MSILKIARMGHPTLRRRARPVDLLELTTAPMQKLIDDMIATMKEYQGLFVAGVENGDDPMPLTVIVNPKLTLLGDTSVDDWEGCLSIPDVRGRVPRAPEIDVRGFDRQGKSLQFTARGMAARVIQHETDHLDGILFLDRMKTFESLAFIEEYSRFLAE
jgi:peptide deformylase